MQHKAPASRLREQCSFQAGRERADAESMFFRITIIILSIERPAAELEVTGDVTPDVTP
jgi:hypothetical protein